MHAELSSLFKWNPTKRKGVIGGRGSKKNKLPQWTHTWVCLANRGEQYNPSADTRAAMQLAGLGEKRFSLLDFDPQEIHEELIAQFPKLENTGGYELLRTAAGGVGMLQLIKSPPNGFTVEYLRAVVGSAKIFIRPLQQDLDMVCVESEVRLLYRFTNPCSV